MRDELESGFTMESEDFLAAFGSAFQVDFRGFPAGMDGLFDEPIKRLGINLPKGLCE